MWVIMDDDHMYLDTSCISLLALAVNMFMTS